jgi:hypothetical protein
MATNDSIQRSVLPIPDRKAIGLTTYDAKDPDTKFPPITQLRPPTGAPNVLDPARSAARVRPPTPRNSLRTV